MSNQGTIVQIIGAAITLSFIGCAGSPTVGDRLLAEGGTGSKALGEAWNEAAKNAKDGESDQKEGREMVSDGEKLIKRGDKKVASAAKQKAKIEAEATHAGYISGQPN